MSTIYVLLKDGQQVVHEESHVQDLLQQGLLTRDTLFWKAGMPEWKPLHELFSSPAPAVPATKADSTSQEPPASSPSPAPTQPAPSTAQPVPSASALPAPLAAKLAALTTPPAQPFYDEDDYPKYEFRLMHQVRFQSLLAALFDLFMVFVPNILIYLFGWFILNSEAGDDSNYWFWFGIDVYYIGLILVQVWQSFEGRSLGKGFFGLRVVDVDTHMRCGFGAYLLRLVIHGFYTIVPFCIVTHQSLDVLYVAGIYALIDVTPIFYDDRCLHDYIAGTTVAQRSLY